MRHDEIVATEELTCGACPTQYEGTLKTGECFYFRYRFGHARLGIGDTPEQAIGAGMGMGSPSDKMAIHAMGDRLDGDMNRQQYVATFERLYNEIVGVDDPHK